MKKVFLYLKNDSALPMIQVYLNGYKGIQVFVQHDSAAFKNDLSFIGFPDALFIEEEFISQDIKENLDIIEQKICVTTEDKEIDGYRCFNRKNWEKACEDCFANLGENLEAEEFSDVPFHILKKVITPVCDIYIQISKNGLPHRIKLFHATEAVDQMTVEKYLDKGVRNASVKSSDKLQFLNSISNQIYTEMLMSPTDNIVGKALDTALILLKDIGFNSTSTQLIEGVVDAINEKLSHTKDGDLLAIKDLLNSKTSRYFKKAHLVSMLCGKIIELSSWGTHKHQNLMTFVALMADMTLDKEEMLFLTDKKSLEESSLDETDKSNVWTHSRDAFHMIQAYRDRPLETDLLILEHHGNKNGVGFSEQISTNLNKLTIIYRICEDFTIELLKLNEMNLDIKIMDIFQHLYIKHDKKVLHLVIDDLKKCFFN
ncbi:hypothetical protein [Bacteriovorax sp. Seq25_V]|uniref:hypothetical protein n=1 Tax=Bacteriovorax sp. Seq25_V TaxID=1201288 RepID=UPI000389F0BE|nr:hypothetical protein [Bacteriovorax sp. Seq25_V]EQC45696.1 hypothetical protein M900_2240 [Bacteriovorax sp. Seq25_V]